MKLTKKVMALLLASSMALVLAACGGKADTASGTAANEPETKTEDTAAEDAGEAEAEQTDTAEAEAETEAEPAAVEGDVSVFYYTYGDTYISSVRSALDASLEAAGIPYQDYDSNNSQTTQTEVIFFNRSVSEEVVSGYDKCVFVGTDYEMAGHMQGEMIGEYLMANFDAVDLNGDGQISYVMFKGQEGNAEAIARTQFGVEDADAILTAGGKPALSFYDSSNENLYLVDQDGAWSAAAANNYMQTILSQYSEANGNMVELVIANNDEMAIGSVTALQNAGYNLEDGSATVIPVFGVDATDAAKEAIGKGTMTGTIKQDADGMANTIAQISSNFLGGADTFTDVAPENVVGTWRVNIPYATYTGE